MEYEVDIELEKQSPINVDLRLETAGITEHNLLENRNLPDQHPISAITGLQEALDTISDDYVSDAELESSLLEKQDVISDLATIRSGATLGATAVQPNELESYATLDYVDDGLSGKQDTLTAGTGISIIDNVISNTQTSAEWGNITGTLSAQTDLWNVLNAKANTADIPTATSDLTNDSGFITSSALSGYATQTWVENKGYITSSALTPYVLSSSLATVATSGNYNDLTNKPTIPTVNNATLTIQKNSSNIDTFTANASVDKIINITVPTTASEVSALSDSTKYGASIDLSLDTTNYKLTLTLKDQDGTTLNSKVVDFPIESVVVYGSYDAINQKIVLTLQNGNTIDIPVGALIAGLQTEITVNNKLDADLVDDNTSTNKFVTSSEKTSWNSKQDAIGDLSTIRSNATNGASAYTTIQGYGNIVTHNVSEFATSAQGTLADSAVQPADLATVATSGSYNDLTDKPTIPTATSDLINDSGFITNTALVGYATESWVGQQGYITGITSSDVTTALGYTPYDANNPSGYITSSALTPYALSSSLATVATSGDYDDLINKPTIPAAQVNSDWNAVSGVAQILNKPTIPTDTSDLTNGAGYITSSALSSYADDNAVVHKTGNETVGGVKTFSSDPYIKNGQPMLYFIQPNFIKGSIPESQILGGSFMIDDSGNTGSKHRLVEMNGQILTNGTVVANLYAYKNVADSTDSASISVTYPVSGSPYATCPTPTEDTTTSKQIDTVGARNTAIANKQDTLVSGTNIKTINNISLLGSGNIDIQGGGGSYTAGTGIDITNNVISADIATSVSSASTNSQSVGAKLFYDTVGDIETTINTIRGV